MTAGSSASIVWRYTEVTFGFFEEGTTNQIDICNLSFTVTDIDSADYVDRMYVAINEAVDPQLNCATTGGVANDCTVSLGTAVSQPVAGRACFQGSGSVGPTSTAGNAALQFRPDLLINQVTVRFRDQLGNTGGGLASFGTTDPGTIQWVGIGDLTFCQVP